MRRYPRWTTLAVAVSCTLAIALVPVAASAQGSPAPAAVVISKVVFTGTSTAPVITITGSGFGTKPAPNPKISPAKAGAKFHSTCNTQPLQGNGNDGHDFGPTALGVGWGTSGPDQSSAGVYVPGSYLDCVGLIVVRYTTTKVVLHLGCQYALYTPIAAGDDYQVQVAGVTRTGIVAYS
jgi:hypothetical protein